MWGSCRNGCLVQVGTALSTALAAPHPRGGAVTGGIFSHSCPAGSKVAGGIQGHWMPTGKGSVTSPGVIQTRCGLRPMGVVTVGLAKAQRQEIVLENAALRSALWDQRSCPVEGVNPSEPTVGGGVCLRWCAGAAGGPGPMGQQSSLQRRL